MFALAELNDMRESTNQISNDLLPRVVTISHAAQNVQCIRALTLRFPLLPVAKGSNRPKRAFGA